MHHRRYDRGADWGIRYPLADRGSQVHEETMMQSQMAA
jgi:hypothetical protein